MNYEVQTSGQTLTTTTGFGTTFGYFWWYGTYR